MSKYKLQTDDKSLTKPTKFNELSEDPKNSSNQKLLKFLRKIRSEEYFQIFKDNEIYFEDLQFLKENDILELNLPIGPRNRLINAIENIENFQTDFEETDGKDYENLKKLKEIHSFVLVLAQKQNEILISLKKCQNDISEMKDETNDDYSNRSNTNFKFRKSFSSTSPKANRLTKPTLSSIAKQKIIPNKYMQVSPLRASYYSRLMN